MFILNNILRHIIILPAFLGVYRNNMKLTGGHERKGAEKPRFN